MLINPAWHTYILGFLVSIAISIALRFVFAQYAAPSCVLFIAAQ